MSASTATPCLVLRRYFLSQMSCDAGCIGISSVVRLRHRVLTASRRTVLMTASISSCCGADRAGPVVLVMSAGVPGVRIAPTAKPRALTRRARKAFVLCCLPPFPSSASPRGTWPRYPGGSQQIPSAWVPTCPFNPKMLWLSRPSRYARRRAKSTRTAGADLSPRRRRRQAKIAVPGQHRGTAVRRGELHRPIKRRPGCGDFPSVSAIDRRDRARKGRFRAVTSRLCHPETG